MKKIYNITSTLLILFSIVNIAVAQSYTSTVTTITSQDSTVVKKKTDIEISIGAKDGDETTKYPRAFGGITFSRIDWGFSRIMDDGAFTLSEDNQFLKYKKASNFGFDVAQFGLRASDNFKTYISAGFEWNYLRLEKNILLNENTSPISYEDGDVEYKKNVFTTTYFRMPLTFEWRSDKNRKGERVKVAFGAMTGVLLKGTQRLKSKENGKQKFKDNYSLASFQYGPFIRLGYDDFGIFAKYYVNDFFEKSPAQKNLNNLAFGISLGF
ncbi:outer membrane beta-barrel protein [Sphingobacterium litopenaei]|uniref:PorT family protein n=1 Tax=Sphingobacterium litopenaei TaxID=2763500 RepID=A0ABR7YEY6_9SPHI|nr:PorT family protein [Sphingobacterium litopenaei]MBD1429879.1 PorT family protein [Sphingobacterium litopenaei]